MAAKFDLAKFNIFNKELKLEFAKNSYEESTIPVLMFTFQKAAEMEFALNKDIYEFSREQIDELFMNFNCSTRQSVSSKFSIIRAYLDFCIAKGLVPSMFNILTSFWGEEYYDKYINKTAVENQYISREELDDVIEFCANAQDAIIIRLRWEGLNVKEIINLKIDDVKDNYLILKDDLDNITRKFTVDNSVINLAKEAFNQTVYLKANGDPVKSIKAPTIPLKQSDYVIKSTVRSKRKKADSQMISQRLKRIFILYDKPFLNFTNLWISGQLDMAKKIAKEKGKKELGKEEYTMINERYGFGNKGQYWSQTKRRIKDFI